MVGRLILVAIATYVLYAGLLYSLQRRVLYPGAGLSPPAPWPNRVPQDAEAVALETSGGAVDAWYVPAVVESGGSGSPAAILLHGNAEFAADLVGPFAPLNELGVATLFIEYPGFAGAGGSPSEASILEAAGAGYDWLVSRAEVDSARVFAIGRSLGAGAAAGLSRQRPLAVLVLWSPFVSVGYMALRRYGLPPFLVRDRFDTREALAAYPAPVLFFHGRRDRIIPYRHSEILAEAREGSELVAWECGHNDCPPTAAQFWEPLEDFLRRYGIVQSEGR